MADTPITATIARVNDRLATMSYQADEACDIGMLVAAIERMREAIKPFATARMETESGQKVADWHEQHDSDGVSLTWDPEFENESTLTIGQFKRARAAYQGEA